MKERYKSNFTSAILSAKDPEDRTDIIKIAKRITVNKQDQLLLLKVSNICVYIGSLRAVEKEIEGSCTGLQPLSHQGNEVPREPTVTMYPGNAPCVIQLAGLDEPSLNIHLITKSDNP